MRMGVIISIYLDAKVKEIIERNALEQGRSVSNYINYILKKELGEKNG